ncbi:hypothetical protein ACJJTC_001563 [Scirpophaga incertulas]
MPPKKRQQKPANLQDMPASTSTRRRTARRRCQDQLTAKDSREANATPSSSSRRQHWSEDAHSQHSPTPFADTATLFADKPNIKIPPTGKNVRELPTSAKSPTPNTVAEDKIPSNRNADATDAGVPRRFACPNADTNDVGNCVSRWLTDGSAVADAILGGITRCPTLKNVDATDVGKHVPRLFADNNKNTVIHTIDEVITRSFADLLTDTNQK